MKIEDCPLHGSACADVDLSGFEITSEPESPRYESIVLARALTIVKHRRRVSWRVLADGLDVDRRTIANYLTGHNLEKIGRTSKRVFLMLVAFEDEMRNS